MGPDQSSLDREIYQAWNRIVFPDGKLDPGPLGSREEYNAWLEGQKRSWIALMARCHDGQTWLVNDDTAALLTNQLWYTHMPLGEYAEARIAIERCLAHPGPHLPYIQAELPIRLQVARFAENPDGDACQQLESLLEGDDPAKTAQRIIAEFRTHLEDLDGAATPSPAVLGLLAELARARGVSERTIRQYGRASSLQEVCKLMTRIARRSPAPRDSKSAPLESGAP